MLMRFGAELPWVSGSEMIVNVQGAPSWFTSDMTLTVLGILAALEVLATKNADIRAAIEQFDPYVKPTIAFLTHLGVVSATDAKFIEEASQAGYVDYLATFVIVPGVWFLTQARTALFGLLSEADEDDDIGIQKLISWAEDIGVIGGLVLLVLFPLAMLVLIGIVSGTLVLVRRRAETREQKSKQPCGACGQPMYPSALACPSCAAKNPSPRAIGFLGQSLDTPAPGPDAQAYRLVEKKRCPVCAERLTDRTAPQDCPACGHRVLADQAFVDGYVANVASRVPGVLSICAVLSSIPVIGLIPGVIIYRVQLVSPFRRYMPFARRMFLKGVVAILLFILIAFQWVPVAGAAVVPLMAIINYTAYRGALSKQLASAASAVQASAG